MRLGFGTVAVCALICTAVGCGGGGDGGGSSWLVTKSGNIIQIAYGSGTQYPQYGALHTNSGYFRLNCGPDCGWGTSIVVLPSFWENGTYYQGAPISSWSHTVQGSDLVILIAGKVSGITAQGTIRLSPPTPSGIVAKVSMTTSGDAQLDNRPGEAFKPVMLSSMHISSTHWDAKSAYVGDQSFPIPSSGWIINPPVQGSVFGLVGGSSQWKKNAPTVEIQMETNFQITGWVTYSTDPNDDNVGFWPAADHVLKSWRYTITVKP
ncbi:MAG: hypothetical protein QHI38_10870 [Armatimonadota bacterium]|nr:hypothetical protein [Armatimonadota bacterium]